MKKLASEVADLWTLLLKHLFPELPFVVGLHVKVSLTNYVESVQNYSRNLTRDTDSVHCHTYLGSTRLT